MNEAIRAGLQLTILGMSLVFGLLILLWGLMALLVRLDRPPTQVMMREPTHTRRTAEVGRGSESAHPATPIGLDPAELAAIMVAVKLHRALRRKQAAPAMRSHWPGSLLSASRWVAAGRTRQNRSWPSRGGR